MTSEARARREELLDAAAAYLLRHGVGGLSLRPMARAMGTSARLLIYHFGSRERLLIEAMGVIRARARTEVTAMLNASSDADLGSLCGTFWRWCTAAQNRPYLRLLFEVHGLALQQPRRYGTYLEGSVGHWIELLSDDLARRLGRRRAVASATLLVGAIDGLLLDYLSTGDLARTTSAINLLARTLSGPRRVQG